LNLSLTAPLEAPQFLAGLTVVYLLSLAIWIAAGCWVFKWLLLSRRRARNQPGRLRWINLGLSCWLFLAGLTAVEVYFSLIYDQSDSFNMTNVSKRWFYRHVQKNEAGFRDKNPLLRRAPDGVYRVWFAGDSFTYGHGVKNVDDRFSDRIAAALERAHPKKFAVSNIAETGMNIAQVDNMVRISVEEKGYKFNTLVYVMCLNDIEPYVDERGERYVDLGTPGPPVILRDTYFFNLLWFRLRLAMKPQVRNYYGDMAQAYQEGEPLRRFLRKFDDLHRLCENNSIDLRVAIFPFLHNLGPDYPFAPAHELLVLHCRENEIPVVDLFPVLEPHIQEGLVVNRFDAHPNERAHQLAAEAIEKELLSDLLK
jgi:hypothetical protein